MTPADKNFRPLILLVTGIKEVIWNLLAGMDSYGYGACHFCHRGQLLKMEYSPNGVFLQSLRRYVSVFWSDI